MRPNDSKRVYRSVTLKSRAWAARWVRLLAERWVLRVAPLLAFGMVGAALLGTVGAAAGSAVGDQLEEELGEGIPHEDVYLYEDALRHGHTVLIAYADEGDQADNAADVMRHAGAEDLDVLRENWWREVREAERGNYSGNFDEYLVALHRRCRYLLDAERFDTGQHAGAHPLGNGGATCGGGLGHGSRSLSPINEWCSRRRPAGLHH
mgnify:CR=1 FL=1